MDVEEVARAEPADSDVDLVPVRLGRKQNHRNAFLSVVRRIPALPRRLATELAGLRNR